jgi:hypothetical protein
MINGRMYMQPFPCGGTHRRFSCTAAIIASLKRSVGMCGMHILSQLASIRAALASFGWKMLMSPVAVSYALSPSNACCP